MTKRVQRYGLATADMNTFVGLQRELIIDTTTYSIHVHDGATPGGFATLMASSNLSDLANAATARTNLGLGSAAVLASSAFDAAGAATAAQAAAIAASLQRASNLSDLANAGTARTNLGVSIGSQVQAYDATLAALAAITTAADKLIYATGVDTFATTDFSAFGRTLVDDASASVARATLGLVIGTDVQAQDADLSAIAALVSAADKVPYATGAGTWALATLTSFARTILDDANAAATIVTLGLGPIATLGIGSGLSTSGGNLIATGGAAPVTSVAGKTGAVTLVNTDISGFGTASTSNTGTSGATLPFANGANTWAALNTFSAGITVSGTGTFNNAVTVGTTLGVTGALSANGAFTAAQDIYFTGDLTPAQITGNQNNYAPASLSTASVLRLDSSGGFTLTGLTGGADGRLIFIDNIGTVGTLSLTDESASSTAINRFNLRDSTTTIPLGGSALLRYDGTQSRWLSLIPQPATTTEAAAGTAASSYLSPLTIKSSPYIMKAWVYCSVSGTTLTVGVQPGFSGVVRNSTGVYTFTLSSAVGSTSYLPFVTAAANAASSNSNTVSSIEITSTTVFIVRFRLNGNGALADPDTFTVGLPGYS